MAGKIILLPNTCLKDLNSYVYDETSIEKDEISPGKEKPEKSEKEKTSTTKNDKKDKKCIEWINQYTNGEMTEYEFSKNVKIIKIPFVVNH